MTSSSFIVNVLVCPARLGQDWKSPDMSAMSGLRGKFAYPLDELLFGKLHRKAKEPSDSGLWLPDVRIVGLDLLFPTLPIEKIGEAVAGVLIVRIQHLDLEDDKNVSETLHKIVRGEWRTKAEQYFLRYANAGECEDAKISVDKHAPHAGIYPVMYLGVSTNDIDADNHLELRRVATATPDRLYGANRDPERRRNDAWNDQYRVNDSLFAQVTGYGTAFKARPYEGEHDPGDLVVHQYTELAAYIRLEAALLARSSSVFAGISAEADTASPIRNQIDSLRMAEELRALLIREVQYRNARSAQPLVFQRFLAELEKQFQIVETRAALRSDAESFTNLLRLVEDSREAASRQGASLFAGIFAAFVAVLSLTQVPPAVAQLGNALWGWTSISEQASLQAGTLFGMLVVVILFALSWLRWVKGPDRRNRHQGVRPRRGAGVRS